MIDKKSEHWKTQPWWFRLWAWGVGSRKIQVWLKLLFLTLAVVFTIIGFFDPIYTENALIMMYFLFIQTTCISYGDKNKSWGYTT